MNGKPSRIRIVHFGCSARHRAKLNAARAIFLSRPNVFNSFSFAPGVDRPPAFERWYKDGSSVSQGRCSVALPLAGLGQLARADRATLDCPAGFPRLSSKNGISPPFLDYGWFGRSKTGDEYQAAAKTPCAAPAFCERPFEPSCGADAKTWTADPPRGTLSKNHVIKGHSMSVTRTLGLPGNVEIDMILDDVSEFMGLGGVRVGGVALRSASTPIRLRCDTPDGILYTRLLLDAVHAEADGSTRIELKAVGLPWARGEYCDEYNQPLTFPTLSPGKVSDRIALILRPSTFELGDESARSVTHG